METEWRIARAQLRERLQDHPKSSASELAEQMKYSVSWVHKWRKRLAKVAAEDEQVLNGQSHRPKNPVQRISEAMENRIIGLREALSEQYNRKVGARTIIAYLKREGDSAGDKIPTSTATVWRILRRRQYILPPIKAPERKPFDRPEAGLEWEIDFCTAANVSPEAPDKHQNALEVFSVIDRGSSANIDSQPSVQFDAEKTLSTMAEIFRQHGLPRSVIYDRDPRLVGSQSTDGFPSAFTRFLLCLGCAAEILPPQRPDLKPFVERFQRTLKEECLSKYQPETTSHAHEVLQDYCRWYNQERPHPGQGNHDQPPILQFSPTFKLPALPETVDPDAWLSSFHQRRFRRHVDSRGAVQLWKHTYYIGRAYINQRVSIQLDAIHRVLNVEIAHQRIRQIPLKGLLGHRLEYKDFLGLMCDEARSEWKTFLWRQRMKTWPKRTA